jgi:nudix-type nucleoside diphosphatase (YffH/AdpP family)
MTSAKVLKTEIVHRGWATFSVVTFRTPNGAEIKREIEDHGRAACVLAYDPVRRTALLVRQFRPAVFIASGETSLTEVVAGIVDEADAREAAKREALEEAGVRLGALERIANVWSSPGVCTERSEMFLATYGADDRIAKGGGLAEEQEDIEIVELSLQELAALADEGGISDMKTFALVQTLRLRRPDLFRKGD